MTKLRKVRQSIVTVLEIIGGVLLVNMVVIVAAGVLDRFIFGFGLPWPEELGRFHLIWLSFVTTALTVTTKGHFVIDFLYKAVFREHSAGRRLVELTANVIACVVSAVILIKGLELVYRVAGQESPALGLQMSWVFLSVPVSFLLVLLFYVFDMMEILMAHGSEQGQA